MPDNSSVHVEAIAVLKEMRAALLRYQSETHDALTKAQREITAALDGLQERLHYWQRQLRARQEALGQAKDALARCESIRGPRGERADCSGPAAVVRQAERRVQEAQEAIRTAQMHIKRVEEANARFQHQMHRFNTMLTRNELPRATALLSKCISILQSYIAQQAPSAGHSVSSILKTVGVEIAAIGISAIITGTSLVYPFDVSTEIPVSEAAPVATTSIEKQMEGAKPIEEFVDVAFRIKENKEKTSAEIEQGLQQGQHGTSPPE